MTNHRRIQLNKKVYELSPNAEAILKDYSSNEPHAALNAFLDLQGRIVATFETNLFNSDQAWIIIEDCAVEALQAHLKKYLPLYDANFELVNCNVYFEPEESNDVDSSVILIPLQKGRLVLSSEKLEVNWSDDEFTEWRLNENWPLQGLDFNNEMLLNIYPDSRVSFTKGCYLGQEIIARVHYKGKPPRVLKVVRESECPDDLKTSMTSLITEPLSSEKKGFVLLPSA